MRCSLSFTEDVDSSARQLVCFEPQSPLFGFSASQRGLLLFALFDDSDDTRIGTGELERQRRQPKPASSLARYPWLDWIIT
jgi:hypothetical protein